MCHTYSPFVFHLPQNFAYTCDLENERETLIKKKFPKKKKTQAEKIKNELVRSLFIVNIARIGKILLSMILVTNVYRKTMVD